MKAKAMVYVAGPYSAPDPVQNTRRAIEVGSELLDSGFVTPIVPHLTLMWDLITPRQYEVWLVYDLEVLSRCDALLRIEGRSRGADKEVAFAQSKGIPVFLGIEQVLAWAKNRTLTPV